MAEPQTELDAESVLMNAVLAPDAQDLDRPQQRAQAQAQEEDEDEAQAANDDEPDIEAPDEVDDRAESKPKQTKADDEPTDDYVEIEAEEEGGEPTRYKVAELVESHRALQALKGQEAQILDRVEREAREVAKHTYQRVEHFANETAYAIQAALQLLQAPKPPNADDMLNPQSPNYNPDAYHMAFARYQQANQQFQTAQALGKHLLERAQAAQQQMTAERETAELQKALRDWPDFGKEAVQQKFISDMGKAYGYSPEELDASLTDHRNLKVARDALAYRAMMAKGGEIKKAVEAKAPKLVRTKQEAKAGSAQARDGKGQFVSSAYQAALKSGTDDAWANYFAAKAKAGRF